jgi:hypothetical protein
MPDIQVWRVRDGQAISMRDYLGTPTSPARGNSPSARALAQPAWG